MDVSSSRHKRKHPESNPQDPDPFGGGTPSVQDGSQQNGVEVHPRTKRRRVQFGHELGESTTQKELHEAAGTANTGTKSRSHKQHKKKKGVSRLQAEVENLIDTKVQSALSQDGGGHYRGKNMTLEQKSAEEPSRQNGAQGAKRRKSRKKKKVLKDQQSRVGREAALQYLHVWEDERSSWCFKKKAQFWLLQNMYEEDQVPKLEFKILLRYLEGLQGNQKQLATEKGREVLEGYEGGGESESKVPKKQYRRAVAILRILA